MNVLSQRDRSILQGIVRNCESIVRRLKKYNIDETVFTDNADFREMVLFPLIQIGELAGHLSAEFVREHDEIPWSDIVGMRHIVVHGYDALDASWAWATIRDDVDPLMEACGHILGDDSDAANE